MRDSCIASAAGGRTRPGTGKPGVFFRHGSANPCKQRGKLPFHKSEIQLVRPQMALWRDDNVHGGHFVLPQTEEIPEDALDAVARNGVPAFFRYREAKAACGSRGRTGMDKKHKITRMVANSTIITGRIFRPAGQSARAGPGKRHGATRVPGMKSRFLTKQEGHGISVACGPACFADRLPSGLCLKSQTRRTGSCGLWHVCG